MVDMPLGLLQSGLGAVIPRLTQSRPYFFLFIIKAKEESLPELDINNLIENVDLTRQMNSEGDNDVEELLDFHNKELTIHEFVEMHKTSKEFESVDPIQSEDRMTVGNLTGLSLMGKGL
ncbi:hypothetical protein TNCV_128191 [Trichonephila clavipes]|nr:hypothetical protein TNCV_128191 [Trichonephila clavipes]